MCKCMGILIEEKILTALINFNAHNQERFLRGRIAGG